MRGMSNLNELVLLTQQHPTWLLLVMFWSLLWKGLALWHSAQRRQPLWFLAILVVNLFGVLEMVYLFAVAKKSPSALFSSDN